MPPNVINFWLIAKSQETLGWISDETRSVSNKKKQIGWRFSSEVECFTDTLAVLGSFPNRKIRRREVKKRRKRRRKMRMKRRKRRRKTAVYWGNWIYNSQTFERKKNLANWMKNSMMYLNYQCDTLAANCDIHECEPEKRWRQILSATQRLSGECIAAQNIKSFYVFIDIFDSFFRYWWLLNDA